MRFVEAGGKPGALREILARDEDALTLVFARTKHGAEKVMKGLVADGFNAASIHGNKSQGQRTRAIAAFKSGAITVLVATDVAARGIDIPGVATVVNYDLPEVADAYVHRIGRTARAGRDGEAIALCGDDETGLLRAIERLMKIEIPTTGGNRPADMSRTPQDTRKGRPARAGGGGGGGGGHHARGGGAGKPAGGRGRRPRRAA